MTTLKEAPPCPSCGSVACYIQSENVCRHTRELRPSFAQTELVDGGFEAYVQGERDHVSALVLENQSAKPLRDETGRAFCQIRLHSIFSPDNQCSLFMGHDQGADPTDHIFGPEDEDDHRDEDEKQDDDDDGDTSDDGRLRDESKGVEDAPNKQVTPRKPGQGVKTK